MHFKANKEDLPQMLTYVLQKAKDQGLDFVKAKKLEVALEEILINIIYYAYGDQDGSIFIDVDQSDGFTVLIKDQGQFFDPTQYNAHAESIDLPIEQRKVGGLGLYLAKQLVDRISYERAKGCNILTLQMNSE